LNSVFFNLADIAERDKVIKIEMANKVTAVTLSLMQLALKTKKKF
jgi:hypothetical protein